MGTLHSKLLQILPRELKSWEKIGKKRGIFNKIPYNDPRLVTKRELQEIFLRRIRLKSWVLDAIRKSHQIEMPPFNGTKSSFKETEEDYLQFLRESEGSRMPYEFTFLEFLYEPDPKYSDGVLVWQTSFENFKETLKTFENRTESNYLTSDLHLPFPWESQSLNFEDQDEVLMIMRMPCIALLEEDYWPYEGIVTVFNLDKPLTDCPIPAYAGDAEAFFFSIARSLICVLDPVQVEGEFHNSEYHRHEFGSDYCRNTIYCFVNSSQAMKQFGRLIDFLKALKNPEEGEDSLYELVTKERIPRDSSIVNWQGLALDAIRIFASLTELKKLKMSEEEIRANFYKLDSTLPEANVNWMSSILFNALKSVPDYDFPYYQDEDGEYSGEYMEHFAQEKEAELLDMMIEFYNSVNVSGYEGKVTGIFSRLHSSKEGINKSLSLLLEAALGTWFLGDFKTANGYIDDKVLGFLHQYRYRKVELVQNRRGFHGSGKKSGASQGRSHSLVISATKEKMRDFSLGMPNERGPVREHDRRGHWRQLQNGSITFVRECTINKGKGSGEPKKQQYISEI